MQMEGNDAICGYFVQRRTEPTPARYWSRLNRNLMTFWLPKHQLRRRRWLSGRALTDVLDYSVILCLYSMVSKQGAAVAERKRELFNRIHIEQSVQVCEFLYYLAYKLNIDGSLDTLINIISIPLPVSYNGTHEECKPFKSNHGCR
jgi:hypothetical protein